MVYRMCTLTPAKAQMFRHMTFPAYRSLLGNAAVSIGAFIDDTPVGLALAGPGDAPDRADLFSLFIHPFHRQNSLGTLLLRHAETTLAKANTSTIHTTWAETMAGALPLQKVLARCGWSEPYKRLFVLRGNMNGEFGQGIRDQYSKYESPYCLPQRYAMTPWHDMSTADRLFIQSKENQPHWYEPHANPFREEQLMKPGIAMLLRKENKIAGWVTVHQAAPDTLRYTDIFIRADLKRSGAIMIAMLTHCFWQHMAEGTPKLTWGIEASNKPLRTMCQTRLSGFSHQSWTWGAEKKLS